MGDEKSFFLQSQNAVQDAFWAWIYKAKGENCKKIKYQMPKTDELMDGETKT